MTKPSRHFDKLAKQRKRDHESLMERDKRIAALETELKASVADRDAYVRQALDAQKAHHDEDWRHAEEHHDTVKSTLEQALRDLDDTKAKLSQTEADLESVRVSLGHSNQMLEMERARLAEIQPQLDMIAQQRSDLEHILDGVRDRMKRREAEDERAILNRQLIANARPDFNRR